MDKEQQLGRWRLVLGKYAEQGLGGGLSARFAEIDELMDFLYGREYGEGRGIRGEEQDGEAESREGGKGPSQLTVPSWINKIQELFPKETVERLERHALEKYDLTELLTDARVLEKLEPNMALLKQILSFKGMMSPEVLATARGIVAKVVDELTRKLENQVRNAVMGRRNRNTSTTMGSSRDLDFKRTIRKNLRHYDPETHTLVLERVYFFRNLQRYNPWNVILCVDESGSMLENVVHAAVMAGIFAKLPAITTKLVIFDTEVVDLSGHASDPVEALMSVQLGGGTDIGKALAYCESLVVTPARTILVLISDLFDGGGYQPMYAHIASMIEAGVKIICLTALDRDCVGSYDKTAAKRLTAMGASVASLTPGELANWIGEVIK
ncbi:MAG: VWA domain-containing protein [Oscillospiraceae bacterium]|nr:VWA domain-containing protein [Oscillospiraceae bacterium]